MAISNTPKVCPREDRQSSVGDTTRYWGGMYTYDFFMKGTMYASNSTIHVNYINAKTVDADLFRGIFKGSATDNGISFYGNLEGTADTARKFDLPVRIRIGVEESDAFNGSTVSAYSTGVDIKQSGETLSLDLLGIDASIITKGTLPVSVLPPEVHKHYLTVETSVDLNYLQFKESGTNEGDVELGNYVTVHYPAKIIEKTTYDSTKNIGVKDILKYYYNSAGQVQFWEHTSTMYNGRVETGVKINDTVNVSNVNVPNPFRVIGHMISIADATSGNTVHLEEGKIHSAYLTNSNNQTSFRNSLSDTQINALSFNSQITPITSETKIKEYYEPQLVVVSDSYTLFKKHELAAINAIRNNYKKTIAYYFYVFNNSLSGSPTLYNVYNAQNTLKTSLTGIFYNKTNGNITSVKDTFNTNTYRVPYNKNGNDTVYMHLFDTGLTRSGDWNPDGMPVLYNTPYKNSDGLYTIEDNDKKNTLIYKTFDYVRNGLASNSESNVTWADIIGKPTTAMGAGFTDVYTKSQSDIRFLRKTEVAATAKSIENVAAGNQNQPVYFVQGRPYAISTSVGDENHPVYFENGVVKECTMQQGFTFINDAGEVESYKLPVGTIIAMVTSDPPTGFLYCNGGLYPRTKYRKLFDKIGNTFGSVGDRFKVPDYRGLWLRGMGTHGEISSAPSPAVVQPEGLPNIYGKFGGNNIGRNDDVIAQGAFSVTSTSKGAEGNHSGNLFEFNASNCSVVYGSSNHVTPINMGVYYFIKF